MALTGHADGPPVLPPGNAASVARSLSILLAAATVLTEHPVTVDGAALLAERAAFTGRSRNGTVSVGGSARLLRTRDSWGVISCARPDDVHLLGALVGEELSDHNVWPKVARWLESTPDDEVTARISMLGIAGGVVREPDEAVCTNSFSHNRFRSVEGALVVDFSALWAGPLCAHLLGLAGARIVKVETPQRPDGARRGNAEFYRLLHGGHESVALDPSIRSQRDALAQLVARADIVIESSRPRALIGFGLDPERFAQNGGVWVSITAAGRSSDRIGFGDDIAATSGLVAWDVHGTPLFVGDAIADPLTGLASAAAVLTSRTDCGQLIDMSMSSVVGSTVSTATAPAQHSGAHPPQCRTRPGRAPLSGETTAATLHSLGIEVP
ncbi:CoA transferase [Rhodococcoides fascians A25f]|uniref:CoA transferase n=1 Tax=Rhodococcoides fascians TaxID=1828 RepID=UPI000568E00E|nr:CoA transferase [Rhodococcus fascians]QII09032.1 CoA transferase [Rhodococcus fascians A25f]